jgi:hypothetical protein
MTDRRPTAQEAGDALCDEWGRAFVAANMRPTRPMTYRGGWFRFPGFGAFMGRARRGSEVLEMTDRLWSLARENAEMKDSK